jgi:hypothetical protein
MMYRTSSCCHAQRDTQAGPESGRTTLRQLVPTEQNNENFVLLYFDKSLICTACCFVSYNACTNLSAVSATGCSAAASLPTVIRFSTLFQALQLEYLES